MYQTRVNTLRNGFKRVRKENALYLKCQQELRDTSVKLDRANSIMQELLQLDAVVAECEKKWREFVLSKLEDEIDAELAVIFPEDGYHVKLTPRVLRGKIHIETSVVSPYLSELSGSIAELQGCLFQEVVSFASLVCVMQLLGVNTVYIDEAFAGASTENKDKITSLLGHVKDLGLNLVLIAQDNYVEGLDANTLYLERTLDNKTMIRQVESIESRGNETD